MGFKRIIENSLFAKSLRLAKYNLNKIGVMVLFDIMFLVSAFALFKLNLYFAQILFIPKSAVGLAVFIIFSLIYYLLLLFAYAFFKYCILYFTKSLFHKTDFSFNKLGQFYMLNIIIAGILFAIAIVLNSILMGIKQSYAPFVFIVLAIPFLLVLYIIINISHSLFYEKGSVKDAIKSSFEIAFTKAKIYRETILVMILFAITLWLAFLGSGYLVNLLASENYSLYLTAYAYFKQTSIIIFDLAFYFTILINRISFYSMAKETK